MASRTLRRKAYFTVVLSADAHTSEVTSLTSPLPYVRPRFIVLFLCICLQCLSSALVFTFYAALQVDCWAWPPLAGPRPTRESLLNRDGAFVAIRSSVGSSAVLPFGSDKASSVASVNSWLPTRSESLRAVKVHQPKLEGSEDPVSSVYKDRGSSTEFPLDLDNIVELKETSATSSENIEVADEFSPSLDKDSWAKLQGSERGAHTHDRKNEIELKAFLDRYHGAILRNSVQKETPQRNARTDSRNFPVELINATGPRTKASNESFRGRNNEGKFSLSLDEKGDKKPKQNAAGIPLSQVVPGDDLHFSSHVDDRTLSESTRFNSSLGGRIKADRAAPKRTLAKAPPVMAETEGNSDLYSEADTTTTEGDFDMDSEADTTTTQDDFDLDSETDETTTEGDFDLDSEADKPTTEDEFDLDSEADKMTTERDFDLDSKADKTTEQETAPLKVRRKQSKAEEKLNFSLDDDLGRVPQKVPHDNRDRDLNFSLDLVSEEKPKESASVTGGSEDSTDDTDVYTLLDEKEDDNDDDEDRSKLKPGASSAKRKAKLKLQASVKKAREKIPVLKKTLAGIGKKIKKKVLTKKAPAGRPAPTADAWYAMNTAASSADSVKTLEAQRARDRGARRSLEEKLLHASPLENMYTRAVKTVPATNYLGVGYDAVKGNPLGDPAMMADPGLRSPIIAFTFEQSRYGVTNDLSTLQPLGAYTRPFSACRQSETVSELNTLDDYQKELSVDASMEGGDMLGFNRFSGSGGYKSFAKELASKNTKSYLLRTYCIRYEAGLAQTPSFSWNYTLAFQDAVNHLPVDFDGENEDSLCTVAQWRQDSTADACVGSNIPTWMDFFEQFGTHYIVRLFAGGKMTYQVSMKSSDIKRLKTKGVDVKAELKVMIGGFGGKAETETKSKQTSASNVKRVDVEKETLVIGGKPPGNVSDPAAMAQWSESVEEMPMPVKVELQSLEGLLPEGCQAAFRTAAKYYGKAYGMSIQDLQALELAPKELPEILRSATQVAWAGSPPGYAKCPIDTVVLFGYATKLNFHGTDEGALASYRLVACAAGREKCDGVGTVKHKEDDERIFVVCGNEPLNDLYQVVAESPYEGQPVAVATCPEDAAVVLGFGLAISVKGDGAQHVEVESCQAGQTVCTMSVGQYTQKSFVWVVCADKNYPGIKDLHNVVHIDSKGAASHRAKGRDGLVTVSCPNDESALLGFAMEAHTHMPDVRTTFTTCDKGKPTCSLQGAGVDKGLFSSDHHSLFGWAVCSPNEKKAAHAVTEDPEKGAKYETTGSQNKSPKSVNTAEGQVHGERSR